MHFQGFQIGFDGWGVVDCLLVYLTPKAFFEGIVAYSSCCVPSFNIFFFCFFLG
jgi:hypothetical protein